jgi:hypothetical protein
MIFFISLAAYPNRLLSNTSRTVLVGIPSTIDGAMAKCGCGGACRKSLIVLALFEPGALAHHCRAFAFGRGQLVSGRLHKSFLTWAVNITPPRRLFVARLLFTVPVAADRAKATAEPILRTDLWLLGKHGLIDERV